MLNRITISLFVAFGFKIVLTTTLYGQPSNIDSLKHILEHCRTAEEKFECLTELISISRHNDLNIARKYIDQALQLNPQISDSTKILDKFRIKLGIFFELSMIDSIKHLTDYVLGQRFTQKSHFKGIFLNCHALAEIYYGEYGDALRHLFECLSFTSYPSYISDYVVYNNIGLVYYKLNNNRKAIEYYEKALASADISNMPASIDNVHLNLGLAEMQLNHLDRASNYLQKVMRQESVTARNRYHGTYNIGRLKYLMGNCLSGQFHLRRAHFLASQFHDTRMMAECLSLLSSIKFVLADYNGALSLANKCISLSHTNHYYEIELSANKVRRLVYTETKQYKKLSDVNNTYVALKETLHGKEVLEQLSAFQTEIEHSANIEKIDHQNQNIILNKNLSNNQRSIARGFLAISFLCLCLCLVIVKRYRQTTTIQKLLNKRVECRIQTSMCAQQIRPNRTDAAILDSSLTSLLKKIHDTDLLTEGIKFKLMDELKAIQHKVFKIKWIERQIGISKKPI